MTFPVVESFTGPVFEQDTDSILTLTTPAGSVIGDLLVAPIGFDDNVDTMTIAGWTAIVGDGIAGGASGYVYYKHLSAAPDATYDFDFGSIAGSVLFGGMLRISGHNSISPVTGVASVTVENTISKVSPSIETTVDDALVFSMLAVRDNQWATADVGYPAGMTGIYADDNTLGFDATHGVAYVGQATAGASGTKTWADLLGSEWGAALTFAIAPAPVGDAIPPNITTSVIDSNGAFLTLTADESISIGIGGSGGFVLSTGQTLTYSSGDASASVVYSISPGVLSAATPTLAYTQPTDGWEDTSAGNDLSSFSGAGITNNSTLADGYSVIPLIGQSDIINRADLVPGIDDVYTGTGTAKQWEFTTQTLTDAINTLKHQDSIDGDMGMWLTAVNDFVSNNTFDKPVLFVPCGKGSADIFNWHRGAGVYNGAVASINAAMASNVNNVLEGFFMHHGHTDAANGSITYEVNLALTHSQLVVDIPSMTVDTPFIFGHIPSGGTPSEILAVNTAIDNFSATLSNSVVATLEGLTLFDGTHFDAVGVRVQGHEYAAALELLLNTDGIREICYDSSGVILANGISVNWTAFANRAALNAGTVLDTGIGVIAGGAGQLEISSPNIGNAGSVILLTAANTTTNETTYDESVSVVDLSV